MVGAFGGQQASVNFPVRAQLVGGRCVEGVLVKAVGVRVVVAKLNLRIGGRKPLVTGFLQAQRISQRTIAAIDTGRHLAVPVAAQRQ